MNEAMSILEAVWDQHKAIAEGGRDRRETWIFDNTWQGDFFRVEIYFTLFGCLAAKKM